MIKASFLLFFYQEEGRATPTRSALLSHVSNREISSPRPPYHDAIIFFHFLEQALMVSLPLSWNTATQPAHPMNSPRPFAYASGRGILFRIGLSYVTLYFHDFVT